MNDIILEVKNLTKQFGTFTAVDNISFSVKEGEILGYLGVNGAGKTTTLQMLLGVLKPTSGEITYFGKNLKHFRSEIMAQVNFSSTYTSLPWNLTVEENLSFVSYLYNIKDKKKRIQKVIELFAIGHLAKKQIHSLSAGQQTIVNLAKAFINFPKIVLLDEPTASLDVEIADTIRKLLLEERKNFNTSIILTSHNMAEVEEVCDRVVFVNAGRVIAEGSPEFLAKSVKIAHIALHITQGIDLLKEYCSIKKMPFIIKGRNIVIDIHEKDIAALLQIIAQKRVSYNEISIEKPSLEDYFLQMAAEGERV